MWSRLQVRCFTLRLGERRSMWMWDGYKVYVDSYTTSNGSCFVVTWHVFLNHLLEVGLTRNQETTAPWTLTTVGLFYFITYEDMLEWKFIEMAVGWEPGHTWFHTTLEDPWPNHMILEVSWDGLWTLSFGLSQFHGHGSWLVCEVALMTTVS